MVSTMKALVFIGLLTVGVAVADFDESVSNELNFLSFSIPAKEARAFVPSKNIFYYKTLVSLC